MNDSIERVKQDIAAYKAQRGPEVFACPSNHIDETCGYGDELVCVCRDPEVKPWTPCPIHDAVCD